jgi:glycine dehydrogenase subunit 1
MIAGVERVFSEPFFHEVVITFDIPAADVLRAMEAQGIMGGLDLTPWYPELGNALLVCATETKTQDDIRKFLDNLERIVSRRSSGPACTRLKPAADNPFYQNGGK